MTSRPPGGISPGAAWRSVRSTCSHGARLSPLATRTATPGRCSSCHPGDRALWPRPTSTYGSRLMLTASDVRACAMSLPRTEEHLIRDHVKFRVGRIVYAAVAPDETILGFGFPRGGGPPLVAAA